MNKIIKEAGLTLASVFTSAFLLNYVWESYHAVYLYEAHDFNAEKYVRMLTYVSVVDGVLVVGIYLIISALWKNLIWLQKMDRSQALTAVAAALAIAAAIEFRKVFVLKAWSYTPLMPVVFGIGVSPLLQLSVTGLLSFWLTKRMFAFKERSI
jgi:phosphate/sulfate permease